MSSGTHDLAVWKISEMVGAILFNVNYEKNIVLGLIRIQGQINVVPTSTPIKKVPFEFYVPYHVDPRVLMAQKKMRIILSRIKPPKHHDRETKI